jgi:large subunit ribosomal protein L29
MTAVRYTNYVSMTVEQKKEALMKLRKEQMNLRFQKATGQMEKPNRWREVKLEIARLQTAINEKGAN